MSSSSEDRPSCELGEKRSFASWDDGDFERLGAGGVPSSSISGCVEGQNWEK